MAVVCEKDTVFQCGESEVRGIVFTASTGLLHGQRFQRRLPEQQAAENALVEILVGKEAQHNQTGLSCSALRLRRRSRMSSWPHRASVSLRTRSNSRRSSAIQASSSARFAR